MEIDALRARGAVVDRPREPRSAGRGRLLRRALRLGRARGAAGDGWLPRRDGGRPSPSPGSVRPRTPARRSWTTYVDGRERRRDGGEGDRGRRSGHRAGDGRARRRPHGDLRRPGRARSSRSGSRARTRAHSWSTSRARGRGASCSPPTSRRRRRSTARCSGGAPTCRVPARWASTSSGRSNGRSVAGMMQKPPMLPAEVPPHWAVYFAVSDTDAAVSRVAELGGTVLMPPMDIEPGRFSPVDRSHRCRLQRHRAQTRARRLTPAPGRDVAPFVRRRRVGATQPRE